VSKRERERERERLIDNPSQLLGGCCRRKWHRINGSRISTGLLFNTRVYCGLWLS